MTSAHFNRHRAGIIWGWECFFCDADLFCVTCNPEMVGRKDIRPATLEHIVPLNKGGTYEAHNLSLSCMRCNNAKGTDPIPPLVYCMAGEIPLTDHEIRQELVHFRQVLKTIKPIDDVRAQAAEFELIIRHNISLGLYKVPHLDKDRLTR